MFSVKSISLEEIRSYIWFERLLFVPIKMAVVYYLYTYVENGMLYILFYLIYSLGVEHSLQSMNSRILSLEIDELKIRLSELEKDV